MAKSGGQCLIWVEMVNDKTKTIPNMIVIKSLTKSNTMSDKFELSPFGGIGPVCSTIQTRAQSFAPKHNWIQQKSKKLIQPPVEERRKKNKRGTFDGRGSEAWKQFHFPNII